MNDFFAQQFREVLDLCNSLPTVQYQPSVIPCKAIINLCQIAKQEDILLQLLHQYQQEVKKALNSVDDYARNADNWRVKNDDCSLGFGVKDHCTILNFLLNLNTLNSFCSYSGVFNSQETIISFLYDWQKIEFTQRSSLLVN
jgi:hypothetical protein